tara:strand:- start:1903 stop:2187 length:285 start_codon:yes stop_codon:yes gene_type:complete
MKHGCATDPRSDPSGDLLRQRQARIEKLGAASIEVNAIENPLHECFDAPLNRVVLVDNKAEEARTDFVSRQADNLVEVPRLNLMEYSDVLKVRE